MDRRTKANRAWEKMKGGQTERLTRVRETEEGNIQGRLVMILNQGKCCVPPQSGACPEEHPQPH